MIDVLMKIFNPTGHRFLAFILFNDQLLRGRRKSLSLLRFGVWSEPNSYKLRDVYLVLLMAWIFDIFIRKHLIVDHRRIKLNLVQICLKWCAHLLWTRKWPIVAREVHYLLFVLFTQHSVFLTLKGLEYLLRNAWKFVLFTKLVKLRCLLLYFFLDLGQFNFHFFLALFVWIWWHNKFEILFVLIYCTL